MSNIKGTKYWWVNSESQAMLERGYLLPGQTVENKLDKICTYASNILGKPELKERFLEIFANGWASLSSPIWANFGESRGLPISCFTSLVDDDVDQIFDTLHEVAMMTKNGGGTACDFSRIRPKGAPVSGGGTASGVISFIEPFDTTIKNVSQAGVRRGGFAAYLDINHPEILDFLRIKDRDSTMQSINTAINVDDKFMEEMIAGDPHKRDVWAEVIKSRREKGIPYITFIDTINKNAPQVYKDKGLRINSSNLCVHGSTKILTATGYQEIGMLEGQDVTVWNGESWSNTTVFKTGENKSLLKISTDDGYEVMCTPQHKFHLQRGYLRGVGKNKLELVTKEAKDLVPGDKLIKFELPVIEGIRSLEKAYTNGFYSADGCYSKGKARITVYKPKEGVIPYLEIGDCNINWEEGQNRFSITNIKGLQHKYFVPDSSYSIDSRLKWLAGVLDGDGTVTDTGGAQTLQLCSIHKNFLVDIQLMLQTLGCDSKVTFLRSGGNYMMPANDGTGLNKEYNCKESHRLLINGNSLYKLIELGIEFRRLTPSGHKPSRECSAFIKVKAVEKYEGLHDTFCFTEPVRNMGMFNGMLLGNCNEIMLSTSEDESLVCCLSSMNLYLYDEWKDTDAIELMIYFLDAVMEDFINKTKNKSGFKRAHKFAVSQRALGLGALGFHSLLQRRGISFESLDASYLNHEVFKNLREKSLAATKKMAVEYGEPELMKGTGMRHATLNALAPNTTSGSILGQTSPSIEAYKSNLYTVKLAKGSFVRKNKGLAKILAAKGKDTKEVWDSIMYNQGSVQHLDYLTEEEKGIYKTSAEINPEVIIRLAAQRQKFIDQGQSLNLVIPNSVPIKQINKWYIDAWRQGVKGLYYQRSNSVTKEALAKLMECSSCSA